MITTISNLPPLIRQYFSEDLLLSTIDRLNKKKKKLILLAHYKIRSIDVRKKRNFESLLDEFEKVYERKKIEEAEYHAACKKKNEEGPRFPNAGTTMRFKRYSSS